MSERTVDDEIRYCENRARRARLLKERFPDATIERLPDGREVWTATVEAAHRTGVEVTTGPITKMCTTYRCVFTEIELGGEPPIRVYARPAHRSESKPCRWCGMHDPGYEWPS